MVISSLCSDQATILNKMVNEKERENTCPFLMIVFMLEYIFSKRGKKCLLHLCKSKIFKKDGAKMGPPMFAITLALPSYHLSLVKV